MRKCINLGFFLVIITLSGCSTFTANKDERYKNTLSYESSIKMVDYQCFKSLGIMKNGEYSETQSGVLEFYLKKSCRMDGYHTRECNRVGGEIEKNDEYYWCIVNSNPIWGANEFIIMEKYKSSALDWSLYLKKMNYKNKNQIAIETELINKKKEKENRFFDENLKGDPLLISKVKIGDKVCKIDIEESRYYISNPEKWVFYLGFIERIEGNKFLIRYLGHGNSKLSINDMDNKIIWESPQGWAICD
ncbi:hypothetical protein ACN3ZE_001982 [Providencia rettgeri]